MYLKYPALIIKIKEKRKLIIKLLDVPTVEPVMIT